MFRYIVGLIIGIMVTAFAYDYMKTKEEIYSISYVAERCSLALFDDYKDWNAAALHICRTVQELDDRLDKLEDSHQ